MTKPPGRIHFGGCICPTVEQWEGLAPCPADCPLNDGYTVSSVDVDEHRPPVDDGA